MLFSSSLLVAEGGGTGKREKGGCDGMRETEQRDRQRRVRDRKRRVRDGRKRVRDVMKIVRDRNNLVRDIIENMCRDRKTLVG